jgi:hypothetical protein
VPWTICWLIVLVAKHIPMLIACYKVIMGKTALWHHFFFIPLWIVLGLIGSLLINRYKEKKISSRFRVKILAGRFLKNNLQFEPV